MHHGNNHMRYLVTGLGLGAAAALLAAPVSGARTRRIIRRKAEDATDYVAGAGKDWIEKCENAYRQSRSSLQRLLKS